MTMDRIPINKLVQRLAIEIAVDEGIRDYWYIDTEGYETIGIGFTKNAFIGLDEEAYRIILTVIITQRLKQLHSRKEFKWFGRMPMTVQAVLFNMAYQIGIDGLIKFKKTLNHLKNKRWEMASKEMLRSLWAKQTPKRAKKMSEWIAGVSTEKVPKIQIESDTITDSRGNTIFDPKVDQLSND